MAKRQRTARTVENAVVNALLEKIPAGVKKQIDAMRSRFMDYAQQFRQMTESREALVDPFFRLLGACQAEIPSLSFVQFVGLLDPSVPVDQRDDKTEGGKTIRGYRSHPTYNAALYLQRLKQQRNRPQQTGPREPRLNATQRMARVLATMLQVIRENDLPAFWKGIATELQIDNAGLGRLQRATKETEPLLRVNLRPQQRIPVRVIHIARPEPAAEAAEAA
jgi:hypothetical protein